MSKSSQVSALVSCFALVVFMIAACGQGAASTTVPSQVPSRAEASRDVASRTIVSVSPRPEETTGIDFPTEIRAAALDFSSCDDPPETVIPLPEGFTGPGYTVWQLCYTTPTEKTSVSPWARYLSEEVIFTERSTWTGEAREVIRVQPDIAYNGWTASVLIALPNFPRAFPLWNARNLYAHERHGRQVLWAVQGDSAGRSLETHGILQAWRVASDGWRTPVEPRPIVNGCLEELSPEILNGGSLLPGDERCPDEYYLCAPGRFHCDYEP